MLDRVIQVQNFFRLRLEPMNVKGSFSDLGKDRPEPRLQAVPLTGSLPIQLLGLNHKIASVTFLELVFQNRWT